jgi:glycine/D-amino acid oxidase-like deaminating enzyme/nitrite reductase/ring-hydroxylating ferredoxin subunit
MTKSSTPLQGKHISYWIDSTPTTNFPQLEQDLTVDVAIVGGGIVGLTTAILLKRAGKKVAVIEAERIIKGVSGHTTAKITALHQLIFADLIDQIGEEKTRLYAESNMAAIERVAKFVEEEGIDCDFSRKSAYTFAESDKTISKVKDEVVAALKVGLPASFVEHSSLPFPIAGAIKLDNQAQFHARKYLLHLAKLIDGDGSFIFENTRVQNATEDQLNQSCQVICDRAVVNAQDVVIATHLPILDQGLFFAKTYPMRSYLIGARIDPAQAPDGMFISAGEEGYSIRTTPDKDGLLLIVGGGDHKVGNITNTEERFQLLEEYALSNFAIEKVDYRWSTHDMVSFDKLPFIGKLTPANNHIFLATGFSLWGMSKGTLSGMLLSDLILGVKNPWQEIYDATRATAFATTEMVKQTLDVGRHWIGDRLKGIQGGEVSDLTEGEGKVVMSNGKQVAVSRVDDHLHAVSAVCTHLGCIVTWNNTEQSWDCPCHGARYDFDGNIIHGPAKKKLEPTKL